MTLRIPTKIWYQIQAYVTLSLPNEVTSIGTIRIVTPDLLEVDEIFLPKQEVSVGYSTFAENGLHEIIEDLISADRDSDVERLRFRWHSHGTMRTFFSEIDLKDIEEWDSDWVVNLITNSSNELNARIDIFQPVRVTAPVEVVIGEPVPKEVLQSCKADIRKKVSAYRQPILKGGEKNDGKGLFRPNQNF